MMKRFNIFLNYDATSPVGFIEIDELKVPDPVLGDCAIVPRSKVEKETKEHIEVIDYGLIPITSVDTRPRDQK